jgi:hypothetical protein
MTSWLVSRVTPLHASSADEFYNPPAIISTDDEASSALGLRLFWATIAVVTIGIGVPVLISLALPSAPHPAPQTIAVSTLADGASVPPVISSRKLPKAQPPPPELLQSKPGPVASSQ